MCKFIGKSNERILCKLSKGEILRLYSIVHVAMETTKMSNYIYSQPAKTLFSHLNILSQGQMVKTKGDSFNDNDNFAMKCCLLSPFLIIKCLKHVQIKFCHCGYCNNLFFCLNAFRIADDSLLFSSCF